MAKLKSSMVNMFASLTIICIVAGFALAAVNQFTIEPINASKKAKLENAIKEVVPAFDNSPTEEAYWGKLEENDSLKIYPAKKGGQLIGVAVESNTMKGFNGEIRVIVGFDLDGKIINYAVLQHAETPGLGSKMAEWFKTEKNNQSVLGKNLSEGSLSVSKDVGEIDAITAATISSRAFLDAINRAYMAYTGKVDGNSGATTTTNNVDSTSGASISEESATPADGNTGATSSNHTNDTITKQ